jgi:glycosidase
MRANPDYKVCNADTQTKDPNSVYHYWSELISLRHKYKDVFVFGSFRLIDEENPSVFAYEKKSFRNRAIVVLNWSCEPIKWLVPGQIQGTVESSVLLLSNYSKDKIIMVDSCIPLSPWEAFIIHDETSVL